MAALEYINPTYTVSFSGHRPQRLPGYGNPENSEAQKLITDLQVQIENAILRGKDTFIHGCMAGWDILASEQIIALKKIYPHIKLITVVPYTNQYFAREKCWTAEWVDRAQMVRNQHEVEIVIAKDYRTGIYHERNRKLIDYSSELICYWDGRYGGTKYTTLRARNKGLDICNLFSE